MIPPFCPGKIEPNGGWTINMTILLCKHNEMGLAITCTNIRIEPLVIQGTIKQAALYAYSMVLYLNTMRPAYKVSLGTS